MNLLTHPLMESSKCAKMQKHDFENRNLPLLEEFSGTFEQAMLTEGTELVVNEHKGFLRVEGLRLRNFWNKSNI